MSQPPRAYYVADVAQFASSSTAAILGSLVANTDFDVEGTVFLEFVVPRIGSRIDAVLVFGPVLFVIEFKVGAEAFTRDDINQVWDYALDLKNFHRESHTAAIVPILGATHASRSDVVLSKPYRDGVYPPVTSSVLHTCHTRHNHPVDSTVRSVEPGSPVPG